jgi:hypothetical protein
MNIVGEGFPKEIINQIYNRQRAYGSGYSNAISRTPQEISYLNANSSWCKLVSSTFIENLNVINNPTIRQLGLSGDNLAKQFILFNGTANEQGLSSRAGIDLTGNLSGNNKAYGIGGTELGIRPMMGIQSVSVSHENRGSLRQASVKMKAWNRTQFEIIDVLYLRLGFSVLLEWGHSMYFDEKYELKTGSDINNSLADDFLKGDKSYRDFLNLIEKKRLDSLGNYDAMFAKVKNFSWSFQKDGSYDITLDLISSGDIIESLKINSIIEDPLSVEIEPDAQGTNPTDPDEDDDDIIDFYSKKSSIGQFFYYLKYQLENSVVREEGKTFYRGVAGRAGRNGVYTFSFSDVKQTSQETNIQIEALNLYKKTSNPSLYALDTLFGTNLTELVLPLPIDVSPEMFEVVDTEGKPLKVIDAINYPWDDKPGDDSTYYVRLGTFLAFIQNYLMPRFVKNQAKDGDPMLNVDYDQNTNLMSTYRWQVSVDPRICIIGRTIPIIIGYVFEEYKLTPFQTDCSPFINDTYNDISKGVEYGNIMNIYVNMRYVLDKIDSLKDDKNKVSLFDLLKGICEGINEGLGGLNSLEPIIDETTGTIKIIDANPLPNRDEVLKRIQTLPLYSSSLNINTELVSFDLYGYKTDSTQESAPIYNGLGHASFIKDFSFATEITPELATMVTVGAAANGSVVGENQTALSKLNVGLYDRYKKEVLDLYEIKKRQQEQQQKVEDQIVQEQEELKALYDRFKNILKDYFDFLEELSDVPPELVAANEPTLNVDEVDAHKGTLNNIVQVEEQIKNKIQNIKTLKENLNPNNTQTQNLQQYTGFIPFNLSITMDGLSGMKIYSKFIVDSSYLPSNYPNNVEFLIKGINHEIVDNKWTTKLESFCISVGNFEDTLLENSKQITSTEITPFATIIPGPDVTSQFNPQRIGALPYDNSSTAINLKLKGQSNGLLNINDTSILVPIGPGANTTYYPDGQYRLAPAAAKAYKLFKAAAESAGYNWTLTSAYRSRQHQAGLGSGSTVASPGFSPHGWGGAFDVSELYRIVGGSGTPSINASARQTSPLYKWMAENGPRFGWYNPYRLANNSGVDEIWHWEYWGDAT